MESIVLLEINKTLLGDKVWGLNSLVNLSKSLLISSLEGRFSNSSTYWSWKT